MSEFTSTLCGEFSDAKTGVTDQTASVVSMVEGCKTTLIGHADSIKTEVRYGCQLQRVTLLDVCCCKYRDPQTQHASENTTQQAGEYKSWMAGFESSLSSFTLAVSVDTQCCHVWK